MATITLTANTNVSALSLANDDTIDLAGFQLNFDVQPTVTGIQVTSPGTAGTCVFPVACVIPTWDFFAGTIGLTGMIATLPSNCEIGNITGGTSTSAYGINTNNGVVNHSRGGSGNNSRGINTNNGTVALAQGGSNSNAFGIGNNEGICCEAIGGTFANAFGISTNNRKLTSITGGTVAGANGVNTCNTPVESVTGGSVVNSHGVNIMFSFSLRITDTDATAVNSWRSSSTLVSGPDCNGTIKTPVETIYSIGPMSESAILPAGATVIELSEGGGTGTAGFTGIEGISRSLGT